MALHPHDRLSMALSDLGPLILAPALLNMFRRQRTDPVGNDDNAIARFLRAREIYDTITNNPPPSAVFYSIRHLEAFTANYHTQRDHVMFHIRARVVAHVNAQIPPQLPSLAELTGIFTAERNRLAALPVPNEAETIQLNIYNHYIDTPGRINNLHTALTNQTQTVAGWFVSPAQQMEIDNLARGRFYGVADVGAAVGVGQIYGPGPAAQPWHNWGLNCAWVLGLIRQRVNIRSLTPIIPDYQTRGHPFGPPPHPSAFVLEIATVLTAGYILNYNVATREITFTAPPFPPIDNDDMTGQENQLLLQTRQNQLAVYQRVIAQIALGRNIVKWSPFVVSQSFQQRLHILVVANANNDVEVAAHPHTSAADLAIIAGRTQAAHANIATNPNADAATLHEVVANAAHNAASDTAVARHPNTAAADLQTIANRTANAADLAAIAGHANANAATLHEVIANAAHNAASDIAVAGNANTAAVDLVTIANRTVNVADLTAIAAIPVIRGNQNAVMAIIANANFNVNVANALMGVGFGGYGGVAVATLQMAVAQCDSAANLHTLQANHHVQENEVVNQAITARLQLLEPPPPVGPVTRKRKFTQ